VQKPNLIITEERFEVILKTDLGANYEKALELFQEFKNFSFDVTNVLQIAHRAGKIEDAIARIEEHLNGDVGRQDPEIRGLLTDAATGRNSTADLLRSMAREYHYHIFYSDHL
jgi:hypothetical protein